jgi:hypothetical protein
MMQIYLEWKLVEEYIPFYSALSSLFGKAGSADKS